MRLYTYYFIIIVNTFLNTCAMELECPQELWLTIAWIKPTLQTIGRLKCVNHACNQILPFDDTMQSPGILNNLSTVLAQDFDTCTDAFISCAYSYDTIPQAKLFFKYLLEKQSKGDMTRGTYIY